jgi:hypothetical protein
MFRFIAHFHAVAVSTGLGAMAVAGADSGNPQLRWRVGRQDQRAPEDTFEQEGDADPNLLQ